MLKAKEWLKLKDPLFISFRTSGDFLVRKAMRLSDNKLFYLSKYYELSNGKHSAIVSFLDDNRHVRVVMRVSREIKTVLISEINEIVYA